MNKIFYIALAFLATSLMFTSCSDDDEVTRITPSASGTVTDNDGNEYKWVRLGNLDWTTSNAKNGPFFGDMSTITAWGTIQYVFYADEREEMHNEYMPKYGNLMNFEDAVASAPEGWRVPTDEDWKALERALGMGGLNAKGWRGNGQSYLMMEGEEGTGLHLVYGGALLHTATSFSVEYILSFEKIAGYYWTSTIDNPAEDSKTAFARKIMLGQGGVERQSMRVDNHYLSVRWVRDAK